MLHLTNGVEFLNGIANALDLPCDVYRIEIEADVTQAASIVIYRRVPSDKAAAFCEVLETYELKKK